MQVPTHSVDGGIVGGAEVCAVADFADLDCSVDTAELLVLEVEAGQRVGVAADGTRTDRAQDHEALLTELSTYLEDWRTRYPEADPTLIGTELPERTQEQLRALGYLD